MAEALVIGGGIFGLSCAMEFVERGWSVKLFEPDPNWSKASSGGDTRMFRLSHGDDAWHRDSARKARRGWERWADLAGTELFRPTGVVWMDRDAQQWAGRSFRALAAAGDEVEALDDDRLGELLPGVNPAGVGFAFLEEEAGVLFADRSRLALQGHLMSRGVEFVAERVEPAGASVRGEHATWDGDAVVWACGPWLARLFPGLVEIEVTQQDLVNVRGPSRWDGVPAWLDLPAEYYGTGELGTGIKVASDAPGRVLDPTTPDRDVQPDVVEKARAFLRGRFPNLAEAEVVETRVCQYSRTPDSEFIIDSHPDHEQVWIVGGGSGHGFKHGPALGSYVADIIEGRDKALTRHQLQRAPSDDRLRMASG